MSLFESGNKGVKFTNIGDEITGTVTGAPYERQQTKFGTQEPDFWPNGDPKMQILVPLQTTLRDDGNDDGERTLYVASRNMKQAIGQAIREANASDIVKGGVLTVKYVGNDPNSKNPANPAKLYQARYSVPVTGLAPEVAPAAPVAPAAQVPAAPQPVAQPAPVAQPPAAPAAQSGLSEEQLAQIRQLRAAGIPDETITVATGATADQLAFLDATPF